ncbi:MAG: NYN domain-containing protein [Paracoccaceae bacterium]
MRLPSVLLLVSLAGFGAALAVPELSDWLLLAVPSVLASLILLLNAMIRPKKRSAERLQERPEPQQPPSPAKPRHILVDGSNVLHWKDGTPQIDALRAVLCLLTAKGYTPGVVFDANAGYLVAGRYQHHKAMGALLGLPEDRVMVVAKGAPADLVLLAAARDLGARIVTNDRFRDWAEAHPEVREPGHLVKGGFRDTGVWLDLEQG